VQKSVDDFSVTLKQGKQHTHHCSHSKGENLHPGKVQRLHGIWVLCSSLSNIKKHTFWYTKRQNWNSSSQLSSSLDTDGSPTSTMKRRQILSRAKPKLYCEFSVRVFHGGEKVFGTQFLISVKCGWRDTLHNKSLRVRQALCHALKTPCSTL